MKKGILLLLLLPVFYLLSHFGLSYLVKAELQRQSSDFEDSLMEVMGFSDIQKGKFERRGFSLFQDITIMSKRNDDQETEPKPLKLKLQVTPGPALFDSDISFALAGWSLTELKASDDAAVREEKVLDGTTDFDQKHSFVTYHSELDWPPAPHSDGILSAFRGSGTLVDGELHWEAPTDDSAIDLQQSETSLSDIRLKLHFKENNALQPKEFELKGEMAIGILSGKQDGKDFKISNLILGLAFNTPEFPLDLTTVTGIQTQMQLGNMTIQDPEKKLTLEVQEFDADLTGEVAGEPRFLTLQADAGLKKLSFDSLRVEDLQLNTELAQLSVDYLKANDALKEQGIAPQQRQGQAMQFFMERPELLWPLKWSVSEFSGKLAQNNKSSWFRANTEFSFAQNGLSNNRALTPQQLLDAMLAEALLQFDKSLPRTLIHLQKHYEIRQSPAGRYLDEAGIEKLAQTQTEMELARWLDTGYFAENEGNYLIGFEFKSGRSYVNGEDINFPYRPAGER